MCTNVTLNLGIRFKLIALFMVRATYEYNCKRVPLGTMLHFSCTENHDLQYGVLVATVQDYLLHSKGPLIC